MTEPLRDGDSGTGTELNEPLGEVGGGLLNRQGVQVRLREEIAVAPPAGGHAHLRDGSGIAWSRRPNDQVPRHKKSVARGIADGTRQSRAGGTAASPPARRWKVSGQSRHEATDIPWLPPSIAVLAE